MTILKLLALALIVLAGRRYIASEHILCRRAASSLRRHKNKKRRKAHYLYWAFYWTLISSVAIAPFVENDAIRYLSILYISLNMIAVVVYRNIMGFYLHERAGFDEEVTEVLWRELDMTPQILQLYYREILQVLIPAACVVAILLWRPEPSFQITGVWGLLPLVTLTIAILVYLKGWQRVFPSGAIVFPRIALHIYRDRLVRPPAPAPVTLPLGQTGLNKIVFIMDESVRGDILRLDDPARTTVPYLSRFGTRLVDFGVALSGHNCSSYSRYLLRYGVRIEELPSALANGLNLAGPNIWQYAKAAGFKTVYVDGFSSLLRMHSGMSLREASFIDCHMKIRLAAPHERDRLVADELLKALADPSPAFIYVDKFGIHAPYADKRPADRGEGAPKGASRREALIAEYKLAVEWGVDGFFQTILEKMDLSRTALFYTSDHGQSLMDGGYVRTHCSTGPDIADGEALVPLFSISGDEQLQLELCAGSKSMKDQASHFEIFPTLLMALGYSRDAVQAQYGHGLLGEPNNWRKFLSGYKNSAVWVALKGGRAEELSADQGDAVDRKAGQDVVARGSLPQNNRGGIHV